MADFTELEWRKKFRPILNSKTNVDCFVPGEEEAVLKYDERLIWSEIWDWDEECPLMISGFTSEDDGAISWYVCEVPREGDVFLTAEKSEDE